MPRSIPQSNKLVSLVSLLVLFVLAFFMGDDANAQRRRRPAPTTPQQTSANANTAPTAQTTPQKKNITPLRSGDTADGSRLTITSDVPLNDYSAYRSGDRYYVEIPDANAPRAQSGLRGRGFEDVQVQKRGDNAVISFKLQPGATARVSQKFNRLDVELSAPGRGTTTPPATISPTPAPTPATASTQPTPRATPQTPGVPGQTNQTQPDTVGVNIPPTTIPPGAETIPPITANQPPDASASPGASPEADTLATPPADQVAQAQPQPEAQPITQPATAAPSSSLGAVLARNWMLILIIGLVLASLVLVVAARSRARGAAAAPVRRVSRKERREKAAGKLSEASSEEATGLKPVTLPKAVKIAKVEEKPAVTDEVTKEVEPVALVDVERVESEVKNLLNGESYDETLIGSSEAETRQLVATELLAALAARNVEKRERARTAFIKHDYLTEATRSLRTASAPAERASAARSLGYMADKSTTPHLVAALDDEAPEVRRSAVEALAEIGDPVAVAPLQALLKRERDKKVPSSLIERAISSASTAVIEEAPTAATAAQPAAELEETTLETAPVVIDEADRPPHVLETMGLVAQASTTAVVEEEEAATTTESPEVEPSVPSVTAEELAAAEAAAQREKEEEAERLRAEEDERQRLEAEARRAAEEEELRLEREQEERERLAREQSEREEQERLAVEARRQAEEEETARLKAEEEAEWLRFQEEEKRRLVEEERKAAEAEAQSIREEEEAQRIAAAAAEEARQKAEETERLRLEEEQRLAAEATAAEEARRKAEEAEQQRLEEERLRLEAEKLRAEEEARAKEEAEARRKAEEEARLAAEAEAEAQRKAEEAATAARLRAEEEEARARAEAEAEAERQAEAEAERLRAEESARRLAAEEEEEARETEAILPFEQSLAEPALERNDGSAEGWIEFDVAEPEVARPAESLTSASAAEASAPKVSPDEFVFEPSQESPAVAAEPVAAPTSKEIDYAITEKGIDTFDEHTTVPRAILRRLSSVEPDERASAVIDLSRVGGDDSFREINAAFDDPAVEVRNAAARSLFSVHTDRAATFTRALREAPPERRRKIGAALASSGLASEAISQLMGESREKTYDAFSLLFLMSKAGEVQPLMRAIEEHPNNEVRLAVIKLLALSGQQEILPAFRRLAVRGSLPTEVRSAVMEAIYQLSSQSPTAA